MMNILFTYPFEEEGSTQRTALLEKEGFNVYFEAEKNFQYKPYMKDINALICSYPFKKLDLDDFPALQWIQLMSMGFEQVPREKVKEDVVVTNNRGGYSIPMGEWVVLNILELIKNRKHAYKNQSNKVWSMDFSVGEIYNKKVAFIGTGDIAQESVKRLSGFGVEILGVNTNGRSIPGFDQCFSIKELDKVLAQSDMVVICLPYTEETEHLFNKEKLETMKADACLINVSRGKVINEKDLIKHLEEGHLRGVALDVFEEEPLDPANKLWGIDRVVVTAHNSWISEMGSTRRWEMIYENLQRFKNKEELLNVVALERGY